MAAGRPHGYGTALVQLGERPEPRYADSQSRWPLPPRLPGRGSGHHQAAIRSSSDQRPAGRPPAESQPSAGGLTVSARGSDPPEPPGGAWPRSFVTGPWPYLPGGAPPRNPPMAYGPVPPLPGRGRVYPGERPPEPPGGSRPRSFVTGPWPCLPGGTPPREPPGGPCLPGGSAPPNPDGLRPGWPAERSSRTPDGRGPRGAPRGLRSLLGSGVGQEADPRVPGGAAAHGRALEVVAGDPQARAGKQHVVRAQPACPGVQPGGLPCVLQQRPARGPGGEPAHARRVDRAGTRVVTAVGVVRPALGAAHVHGARVGRHRVQRVAAGVVDPNRGSGRRPGSPGRPRPPSTAR